MPTLVGALSRKKCLIASWFGDLGAYLSPRFVSCFSCRGASGLISFPHVQRVRRAFGSCHCGLHRERGERAFFLQAQQMMPPPKPSTLVTSKSGNRCALLISHTRLSCPRKSIQHMKTSNRQCTTLMQTYRMLPVQSANFAGPRYTAYIN